VYLEKLFLKYLHSLEFNPIKIRQLIKQVLLAGGVLKIIPPEARSEYKNFLEIHFNASLSNNKSLDTQKVCKQSRYKIKIAYCAM
jgi:hypothetical protein